MQQKYDYTKNNSREKYRTLLGTIAGTFPKSANVCRNKKIRLTF